MKRNFLRLIAVFTVILTFLYSCEKDEDNADLITDKRDALAKTWDCVESGLGDITYRVSIWKDDTSNNKVVIENLHNTNAQLLSVFRNDSLIIEKQKYAGDSIHGKGVISADYRSIDLIYYIDEGNGDERITAKLTERPL